MHTDRKLSLLATCIACMSVIVSIYLFVSLDQNAQTTKTNTSIDSTTAQNEKIQTVEYYDQKSNDEISGLQNRIIDIIDNVGPAVVNIVITKNVRYFMQDPYNFWRGRVVEKEAQVGGGSGILIRKDGLIITNKHVVEDATSTYSVVLEDGTIYTVANIWFDPVIDIAIIQIMDQDGNKPQNLPVAKFIDFTHPVQIGQFGIAIGNALAEYQNSVTLGIISALNRQLNTNENTSLYIGLYQTDTPINPGNSGGPLIDIFGQVIGINTAISAGGDGIGFALPVNQDFIDATVTSIETHGEIKRPFLGVQYRNINQSLVYQLGLKTNKGAIIDDVVNDSPAQKIGLVSGDIIIAINGYDITSTIPFLYHIYRFIPNQEITILVKRGDNLIEKSVILTEL